VQTLDLDSIFKGAPSSKLRKPLDYFLKGRTFKRYVIPFAGRFAAAATIAGLGVNPQLIETSDISLFSSVVGYYLSHRPLEDLKIEIHDSSLEFLPMSEQIEIATSTLYGLKYFQINDKSYYMRSIKKEYVGNWRKYWDNIKKDLEAHGDIINGIKYKICDALDHLGEVIGDPETFCYINPPVYKEGYTKMFETGGAITWDFPPIPEFSVDKDYEKIFFPGEEFKATAVVMAHDYSSCINIEDVPKNWYKVFANQTGKKITYYVSNKKELGTVVTKDFGKPPVIYPIHTDADPITKNSRVQVMPLDDSSAKYYRDLFIHRLGSTDAEEHLGLFIDGKLMTVFGLTLADVLFVGARKITPETMKDLGYVFENYGITGPSQLNKNRLFMSFLLSCDFKSWLEAKHQIGLTEFKGVKTTCLTRLPENRILHGLYDCVKREKSDNNMWKLVYQSPFNSKTFRATIIEWLDKQRSKAQNTDQSKQLQKISS
jgi:hypothetical protein